MKTIKEKELYCCYAVADVMIDYACYAVVAHDSWLRDLKFRYNCCVCFCYFFSLI